MSVVSDVYQETDYFPTYGSLNDTAGSAEYTQDS
jgi:hypothetical protein